MGARYPSVLAALTVAGALVSFDLGASRAAAQAPASNQPAAHYTGPRASDGKPDLNGVWQVLNLAHWNLEAHSPEEGVPGGQGVVEGGVIPYKPEALTQKRNNYANRATHDPLSRCYLPGVPSAARFRPASRTRSGVVAAASTWTNRAGAPKRAVSRCRRRQSEI